MSVLLSLERCAFRSGGRWTRQVAICPTYLVTPLLQLPSLPLSFSLCSLSSLPSLSLSLSLCLALALSLACPRSLALALCLASSARPGLVGASNWHVWTRSASAGRPSAPSTPRLSRPNRLVTHYRAAGCPRREVIGRDGVSVRCGRLQLD